MKQPLDQSTVRRRLRICYLVTGIAFLESIIYGYTFPYFSVRLENMGVNSTLIGLNATFGLIAVILFAPLYPLLIRKLGYHRFSFIAFIILIFSSGLLFASEYLPWLFLVRFIIGAALAGLWISTEAWLNDIVPDHLRGRINAVFQAVYSLGFFIGPSATYITGFHGVAPIGFLSMVSLTALIMLLICKPVANVSKTDEAKITSNRKLLFGAKNLLFLALVTGLCETAMYALLPIYGLELGFSTSFAVSILIAYTLGEVIVAFPIAWLADKIDPGKLLFFCSAGASLAIFSLVMLINTPVLVWLMAFVGGGLVVSLYNIGLVQIGGRYQGTSLPLLTTAFAVIYSTGSAAGSTFGGGMIELLGPFGLPLGISVVLGVTAVTQVFVARNKT